MNSRQKKKLYKQTLIKVRRLRPKKGDVICIQPDLDRIDIGIIIDFVNLCYKNKVFGEATMAIVPANINQLENKKEAQMLIDKLQSIVNQT